MVVVHRLDPSAASQVRRFVELPYRRYRGHPCWVPPLRRDVAEVFDRRRHPFYHAGDADFFVASRDGIDVGRLAVFEHRRFNEQHGLADAGLALFECEADEEAAAALFESAVRWARWRGLTRLVGPKGFGAFDGYGVLASGFDRRQTMTMSPYTPPYYARLFDANGFVKVVDFVSYELRKATFTMPERVRRIAARAERSGQLHLVRFSSTRALVRHAPAIADAYNRAFVSNWEYVPLSERDVAFLVRKLAPIADPRLVKVVSDGHATVGFLLVFPDLSRALQRMNGRLTPVGLFTLFLESRRTRRVAFNGAGVVPAYQGRGVNALLYTDIERTIRASRFDVAELVQIAETATRMRQDLEALGATPIKVHRVYARSL